MFDPSLGRWITPDPIEFDGGDNNFYRALGNNPTNNVDPSGLAYKPIGETDPKKIEPVLKRVTGTSKDNFEPLQTKVNAYDEYLYYSRLTAGMTNKRGVVEVRVYRRLTTGDFFDFTTLTPAKVDAIQFPFDKNVTGFTKTPFKPYTIKVKVINTTERVYYLDPNPTKTLPTERAICHSVSFGVCVLGRSDGFPIPSLDPLATVVGTAAIGWVQEHTLLVPPATADKLFNHPKLFKRVPLEDIQPGDIIAFYTTAATTNGVFPEGGLIHSFPVTSIIGIAPPPRPAK